MDAAEARKLVLDFANHNKDIPEVKFIVGSPDTIHIKEYGAGQINFVFGVSSHDKQRSIILKHARDSAKFDENEKMSLDRQVLEFNALSLLEKLSPGSVPRPYCLDTKYNIIAMEDLSHMELLGAQLISQNINQEAMKKYGQILGRLHKHTLKANNDEVGWRDIEEKFRGDELRSVLRSYLMERVLVEDDPINKIPPEALGFYRQTVKDPDVRRIIKKLRVVHDADDGPMVLGDCHENGIFIDEDRCALFDMEFAYIGHPAANLAMALLGLILYPLSLDNPDWTKYKTATRNLLECYFKETEGSFGEMLKPENLIPNLTALTGNTIFSSALFCRIDEMSKIITTPAKIEMMKRGVKMMKKHNDIRDLESFLQIFYEKSET